ncbi:hypothetical protein HNQ10_004094, partial [Deinococcus metallilatus]|nr:hypothetical protein [Deinococcus metallilatus]MBB5297223.1 hypothetical protein [Deinococcus metallilatus]
SLSFCRQQANLELIVWLFLHRDNASLP